MIVTTGTQPGSAKATTISTRSRGIPFVGHAYEGFKYASRAFGFYQDIKPYLPETTLDRYRYKPHKRGYGYARTTQGFLKRYATRNKFRKTRSKGYYRYNFDKHCQNHSKGSYCSQ